MAECLYSGVSQYFRNHQPSRLNTRARTCHQKSTGSQRCSCDFSNGFWQKFNLYAVRHYSKAAGKGKFCSPLKSIVAEQLHDHRGICSVAELSPENTNEIITNPPEIIFTSAESALQESVLDATKNCEPVLHKRVSLVVVDESHTVESWSGKSYVSTRQIARSRNLVRDRFQRAFCSASLETQDQSTPFSWR